MKSSKFTTVLLTIIFFLVLIPAFLFLTKKKNPLVNPNAQSVTEDSASASTPSPTKAPLPSPTPESFQFDSTTDLKAQLETVDPQTQNPNIDKLKGIIKTL